MNSEVMSQWLDQRRVISKLSEGRKRVLFIDSYTAHKITEAVQTALEKVATEI